MKRIIPFVLISLFMISCKKDTKTVDYNKENLDVTTSIYPENVSKIFEAHGGIDAWNSFESIYFEIKKPTVNEKHTIALKSRKSIIDAEHYKLGFDGDNVWLKEADTVTYKDNPKFRYNLMFYFYAMPFVLGDDGIHYEEGPELEADGKTYPGILISYDAGIGESPEDEYILFYDPDTYKMAWLAYTVTFFSKEKTKEFRLIKYADWTKVEGLELPVNLQWHQFADGEVGDKRNDLFFVNPVLSKEQADDADFQIPEGARVVE